MMYDFQKISDHNLKQFVVVLDNLVHKADLLGKSGPLAIGNASKGVSKDEQYAILSRLDNEGLASFSNNGKYIYLNEKVYVDKSFFEFYDQIHAEYHKRLKKTGTVKYGKPHYDPINGILHIQKYKIKIKKHEDNDRQNQLLKHIFITNAKDIAREFDFTEFPFDEEDKKKFKKICRTACTAINTKISKETKNTIQGFLEFNSLTYGFLKIDPKYLQ
jgi:hypothetical protein